MSSQGHLLSSKGLSNLVLSHYENDFCFKVGEEKYFCSNFLAEFLSPKVSRIHRSDPTYNEMVLNVEDPNKRFRLILDITKTGAIRADDGDYETLRAFGKELDNPEISLLISNRELTPDSVISRLKTEESLYLLSQNTLQFAAAHLFEINRDEIMTLSFELLENVLSQSTLCIESEEWLFYLISELAETNPMYSLLYGYIHLDHLHTDEMNSLLAIITVEDLTEALWGSIKNRLALPVKPKTPKRYHKSVEAELLYESGKHFEGFFNWLWKEGNGNPFTNGKASVLQSHSGNDTQLTHIVDPNFSTSEWIGMNNHSSTPGKYFEFDLKDYRLNLTAYTIQSGSPSWSSAHYLRTWEIRASVDGTDWVTIDTKTNDNSFNTTLQAVTFEIENAEFYKMFRLVMTGENSSNDYQLGIHRVEFFGNVRIEK